MRYRLLGQTGLRVSELLLGTMVFRDAHQARRVIDTYAEAGGNVLDTASVYGEGESLLGEVLHDRERFVLGSKYTLSRDHADPNASGNHRKNLTASLEQSLRRLRTDHLDLYWVHLWDRHTPIEETVRALDDAVRAGKILYTGFSDVPAWVVARANTLAQWRNWTPFAALQVPYSLLRRDAERELLPMAEALGLSVAAWGPLAGGKLTGSSRSGPAASTPREQAAARAVREVADELGARPAQVALAWLRSRSPALLPLVGVSSPEQLAENLAALDLELPPEALARLTASVPFELGFPGEFIAECEPAPFCFGDTATRVERRPVLAG